MLVTDSNMSHMDYIERKIITMGAILIAQKVASSERDFLA